MGQILSHVYENAASITSLQVSLVSLRLTPCNGSSLARFQGLDLFLTPDLCLRVRADICFFATFLIPICFREDCVMFSDNFPFQTLTGSRGVEVGVGHTEAFES